MENGQFQQLVEELQATRLELRAHTDQMATELRGHTDQVATELRAHSDQTAMDLRAHTDQMAASLRAEIRESAEETRRHVDIRFEALEATDRLLAEGIATVDARVDRLRGGMNAEFVETRAMIKLSYRQLDRRITSLEEGA